MRDAICPVQIPTGQYAPIGVDDRYAATPSLTRCHDGSLFMVWRESTDHVDARDGVIKASRSHDLGATWSPSFLVMESAIDDLRDPCVSTSPNGDLWITYFTGNTANPAEMVVAIRSTDGGQSWELGGEVSPMDLPFAASTAPIVWAGDGPYRHVFYARREGDSLSSVWIASSENGQSWTAAPINNGPVDLRDYSEPWLVCNGNHFMVFHRWGLWDSIGVTESHDSGVTWSQPRLVVSNATGRPAVARLSTGTMVMVYRELPSQAAVLTWSRDDGKSWYPAETLLPVPATTNLGMIYAHPVEIDCGLVVCPVSIEVNDVECRIHNGYISDGN